ncbi:coiled-coil domain-containing protein 43 isoform X1 [Maylandia zebra]|uniref:Coiled-coil domain-containing protein 43 n=3 Tax=Haplochromini TaxID=319058 RepID=A0A3Q3BJT7_HAPBU|nr:coiled-coil domain-containing protein 43 isoform X1 [Maylandia zebra]XP_005920390.1 coiled-coil domain-containing protein 43 isoform X1 [Haplochromis burtoni]XP_023008293.1 coiled-coil domain-containing protein 43 isoform X1 [Maylandia zebra]XP_039901958.1 coiled-coil domain-containing protein 43 isoform X1 [Simochromis diagramma]
MAAPLTDAGEFESWLNDRLDLLEVDREVYGAYILGILQEEETDEEKEDALQGILSAFLEENTVEDVCKQIIKQWEECCSKSAAKKDADDAEVQAIASMIEKQAQIVVKQKEVSEESKKRKEALLAQYANVTDEEDEAEEEEPTTGNITGNDKSLFKNTNVELVLNRQKQKRDQAREEAQKKKEMDKMQREKDKLAKQDRKEKEKKRTQKGERKR